MSERQKPPSYEMKPSVISPACRTPMLEMGVRPASRSPLAPGNSSTLPPQPWIASRPSTSGRTGASERENERAGRFLMARTFASRGAARNALAGVAEAAGAALGIRQILDIEQRRAGHRRDDELGDPLARSDRVRLAPLVVLLLGVLVLVVSVVGFW